MTVSMGTALKADNVKFVRRKSLAYASDRICGNVRASLSRLESLTTITHFRTMPKEIDGLSDNGDKPLYRNTTHVTYKVK